MNVAALESKLRQFDERKDWYLGKPSIGKPLDILDRDDPDTQVALKLSRCRHQKRSLSEHSHGIDIWDKLRRVLSGFISVLITQSDTCHSLLCLLDKHLTFFFAEESLLLVCHWRCRLLLEQVFDGEDEEVVGHPGQVHRGRGPDATPRRRHHGLRGRGPGQGALDQGGRVPQSPGAPPPCQRLPQPDQLLLLHLRGDGGEKHCQRGRIL